MKLIIGGALVALMMSCSSTREMRISEFKEITKDMRIETHGEGRIAQILYLRMVNKRNYEK